METPCFRCWENTRLSAGSCPLSTQDLFFKYTWNNFLHFQVELCIAAILSHATREERAEGGESVSRVEPAPGNRTPKDPQPAASHPEDTLVTHVSAAPGSPGLPLSSEDTWGCVKRGDKDVAMCFLQPAFPGRVGSFPLTLM